MKCSESLISYRNNQLSSEPRQYKKKSKTKRKELHHTVTQGPPERLELISLGTHNQQTNKQKRCINGQIFHNSVLSPLAVSPIWLFPH